MLQGSHPLTPTLERHHICQLIMGCKHEILPYGVQLALLIKCFLLKDIKTNVKMAFGNREMKTKLLLKTTVPLPLIFYNNTW